MKPIQIDHMTIYQSQDGFLFMTMTEAVFHDLMEENKMKKKDWRSYDFIMQARGETSFLISQLRKNYQDASTRNKINHLMDELELIDKEILQYHSDKILSIL